MSLVRLNLILGHDARMMNTGGMEAGMRDPTPSKQGGICLSCIKSVLSNNHVPLRMECWIKGWVENNFN